MLVTTQKAAEITGLSAYELRIGWKQGRYPALQIGRGGERCRLRWSLEALEQAIREQMGWESWGGSCHELSDRKG